MLRYIRFLWKCSQTRFQFFSYPSLQKAKFLAENNLSFLAGIYYLDSKEYTEAASCFEKAGAYKHLIIAYQKQGLYGRAITLADQKNIMNVVLLFVCTFMIIKKQLIFIVILIL
ncbi:hypothetical protein [Cellulosilyticum lentocellum]|uniref:Uncharacterized protein n=1 Tax=Cellulosilyticum lentocellum (strain ATCC 49066 / DSM 5427 / NCIMB 11756 / RHM5) TaxID=642492 RepID=F2JN64_CELLD|nr:hypothetical protein [Cellulosilyticum lentocellum]ADZ83518.1 hypothetical protein Clole_1795 [Cellulosilyticum lentocellum DSM 5427]